mgnify:CR=1 FL=1
MTISGTLLDTWELTLNNRPVQVSGKQACAQKSLDSAVRTAEAYVGSNFKDALPLMDMNALWRQQKATEKQLEIIRTARLHVPGFITRGQASHLIAMLRK